MTEEDKLTLLQLLRAYHKEEKEKTQGLVELKVCEEAAEVLMQDLQSLPTEPEEMDLLMCLVQKHMQNDVFFVPWLHKLWGRKRKLLKYQEEFLRWLGFIK